MTDAPSGQIYLDADIFIEAIDGTQDIAQRLQAFFQTFKRVRSEP